MLPPRLGDGPLGDAQRDVHVHCPQAFASADLDLRRAGIETSEPAAVKQLSPELCVTFEHRREQLGEPVLITETPRQSAHHVVGRGPCHGGHDRPFPRRDRMRPSTQPRSAFVVVVVAPLVGCVSPSVAASSSMIATQSATHSSQMNTPGPRDQLPSRVRSVPQNEQPAASSSSGA